MQSELKSMNQPQPLPDLIDASTRKDPSPAEALALLSATVDRARASDIEVLASHSRTRKIQIASAVIDLVLMVLLVANMILRFR